MYKVFYFVVSLLVVIAGVLVVKFREDMVTWITIGIGSIFFVSGVLSLISYFVQRNHVLKMRKMSAEGISITDIEGNLVEQRIPMFPVVGIGSMILGVVLASMPEIFQKWMTYLFAAFILLISLYQMINMMILRRHGRIGWGYWLMPVVMFLLSIVMLVNPDLIASSPFFFLGWAMIVSGVGMFVNMLKICVVVRAAEKRAADLAKKAESAVEVNEETSLITKE